MIVMAAGISGSSAQGYAKSPNLHLDTKFRALIIVGSMGSFEPLDFWNFMDMIIWKRYKYANK